MERIKEVLATAPFVAVIVAITYLQGYWGKFDVLAFPYLSFQELIAYSTAPLFGYILFTLVGMLIGALSLISNTEQPKSKWRGKVMPAVFVMLFGVLAYFGWPEKWVLVPLAFTFLIGHIFRIEAFNAIRIKNPNLTIAIILMLFMLFGTYCFGRIQAERLIIERGATVTITMMSGEEDGKLIGKLGSYYFFLDTLNMVNVVPESNVVRVQYKKAHHLPLPRFRRVATKP